MKFAIITHAAHKLYEQGIFAYEPYVREMNLWLKFVDEVKIVAPVSREDITYIESSYEFNKRCNDKSSCHPELVEGSHNLEFKAKSLRQAQTDISKEKITKSHTPRNDEQERHSEQSEAISPNQQIAASHPPCLPNRQARNDRMEFIEIPAFDIVSLKNSIKALLKIPTISYKIYKTMQWADHIHLRCPGNVGLLGCFVQVLFPMKPKTIKYAGNWDSNSNQPLSYRLQKWILSNTLLTRNAKVLVYGDWPNQTKNIVPFFTASYSKEELKHEGQIATSQTSCLPNRQARNDENTCHSEPVEESHDLELKVKSLRQAQTDISKGQIPNQVGNDGEINFLFVGALTKGKQPLLSVKVIQELKKKGYKVQLNIYGEGEEREVIEQHIEINKLGNEVVLHGNASKEIIKKAYQNSHFLLFVSKSEGWPKVVAEAMFWACLPISSNVSCIPYMLENGNRGAIVNSDVNEIVSVLVDYLKDEEKYKTQVKNAMEWSRQFTLEKFEEEIGRLLKTSFPT